MNKQLKFTYNDIEYTLEFTRQTVGTLENTGFRTEDIFAKPVVTIPKLFRGAFLANHRNVKSKVIDEIYKNLENKSELIEKLIEMYNDPIDSMLDGEQGNVSWETSF